MHHELPRLRPTGGKAHPKYNVIHPELHMLHKVLAWDALHAARLFIGTPELLLGDTVVPARLLLFQEPDAEFRLPLTAPTVLSWRIGLPLQGILSHIGEHHSCPPITPGFGSRVARHPLPPTPLRRSATVLRLAGYVFYGQNLYTHRLEGASGHVPARAMAFDLNVYAPHALIHRLVRSTLSRHLGRIRRALAATLEAHGSCRLPGYNVALLVGYADDGVVERTLYVHHAGRDVFARPPTRPARSASSSLCALPLPTHLLLPPAYGRFRAFALAGIGLGALSTYWQAAAVPDAPVRADVYEPPDVLVYLAPEVALDLNIPVDIRPDRTDLPFGEIPALCVRVHASLLEDLLRRRTADSIHV